MSKKILKNLAIGAAFAGAAGYLAGLLTAPKSGSETRDELYKSIKNNTTDIESQLKNLQAELGRLVDQAKNQSTDMNDQAQNEFKTLLEKAKDSKEKVQNIITAVHNGKANDKDLKNAIDDAKNAIDHIKVFFKK